MKKVVFTICAKNYIGLAKVLEKSFRRYNQEIDFFIFIADIPDSNTPLLSENIIIAKNTLGISDKEWIEQSFKYNLTEFCTAIKPYCFKWLFNEKGYGSAVYLDPDIFCFSSLNSIFDKLNKYSIILSPHILTIQEKYSGDLWENIFLWAGSYNLGFLALKNDSNSLSLLNWWAGVLKDECFIDNSRYTATDQKWMVLIPAFFSQDVLLIDRDMGIDAAPWNFYEREFYRKGQDIWVRNRIDNRVEPNQLIFVHFSNYKYSELSQGVIKHYSLKNEYKDLNLIFELYVKEIQNSRMNDYLHLNYSYNSFDNDIAISMLNRRIYRRLLIDGEKLGNPFSTDKNTFYDVLRQRKLLSKKKSITTFVRGVNQDNDGLIRVLKIFDCFCLILKKILGVDRYELFIRFASSRFLPENQTYIYDHKSRFNL